MAKLGINTGSSADDGTGDSLRVGGGKINHNFNEIYTLLTGAGNTGTTLLSGIVTSITAGTNISLSGGPTGAIEITAAALTGTGFFTSNSTGIHTLGSVGIGTTTAENNGLSVPLGNVFVGKGVTTLNLNVAGVTTFSGGDINVSGDNYDMMWDASVDTLEFGDNAKIAFGAGSDLTLYHDASNSWIKDQAAGNLLIDSNGAAIKLTKAGAAETMAEFNTDGPVKLFHNNVRKFETVSTGATIVGDLYVGGDLFVLDDVTYDEMNSVNLNVTGVSTFGGTSNLNGDLRVGVSTLFADVSTGRVGVGTDVPGDLFFVDGSLTASGLSTFSGGLKSLDDVTVGFTTFFVDVSTGKVGVGTNVPGRTLEVFSPTSNLSLLTLRTAEGAYGQAGLSFASNPVSGREKASIFFQETKGSAHHTGDLVFSVDNAGGDAGTADLAEERLRITKDGHVGIGTSMPTDRAASSNTRILNVGIVTANNLYGALTGTAIEVTNIVGAAASIAGIVTATSFADSKGALRDIPLRSVTGSAATLVAADAGKVVSTNTTGWTVPASTFSEGDTVSLLNNSAGNLTITCSAVTTYWTSTGATVTSSTLGARGLATLYFVSASVAYLQGTSLS